MLEVRVTDTVAATPAVRTPGRRTATIFWVLQAVVAGLQLATLFATNVHWAVVLLLPIGGPLVIVTLLLALQLVIRLRPKRANARNLSMNRGLGLSPIKTIPSPRLHLRAYGCARARKRTLLLVDVKALRRALEDAQTIPELWTALSTTDRLHLPPPHDSSDSGTEAGAPASEDAWMPRFALVSYRQQRSPGDSFTMDADAIRAVTERAARLGVEGLWLDAWCFRNEPGEEYDHAEFTATLTHVVTCASAVIWLPRSRAHEPPLGYYQFRLWCTFEACVVAERRLPVVIAGVVLSRCQRMLQRCGAQLPLLPLPGAPVAPPELRDLARFNAGSLAFTCLFPPYALVWRMMLTSTRAMVQIAPLLSRQAQLAHNGQRVLATMMSAAEAFANHARNASDESEALRDWPRQTAAGARADCPSGSRVGSIISQADSPSDTPEGVPGNPSRSKWFVRRQSSFGQTSAGAAHVEAATLRLLLPWLPAYDRRDCLIVRKALDVVVRLCHKRTIDTGEQHVALNALALSCFVSAAQRPSDGDQIAGRTLQEWLAEKGFLLTAAVDMSARSPIDPPEGAEGAEQVRAQTMRRRGSGSKQQEEEEANVTVPLHALAKLGWSWQRGASAFFATPQGVVRCPQPTGSEWTLSGMALVREPSAKLQLWPWLAWFCLMALAVVLLCAAIVHLLMEQPWREIGPFDAVFVVARPYLTAALLIMTTATMAILSVAFITPPILFTWHFREAPHFFDLAARLQREGYSVWTLPLPALLINYCNTAYVPLLWALGAAQGSRQHGFGFTFPLGHAWPPNVPAESVVLMSASVAWWACWGLCTTALVCAQGFHIFHRMVYGRGGLLAPMESRHSRIVDCATIQGL